MFKGKSDNLLFGTKKLTHAPLRMERFGNRDLKHADHLVMRVFTCMSSKNDYLFKLLDFKEMLEIF